MGLVLINILSFKTSQLTSISSLYSMSGSDGESQLRPIFMTILSSKINTSVISESYQCMTSCSPLGSLSLAEDVLFNENQTGASSTPAFYITLSA